MSDDPAPAESPARARSIRVFVVTPIAVGALLLAAAVVVASAAQDLGFLGFLLTIVGGWCFGFAFVNAMSGVRPPRFAITVHAAVAVALAGTLSAVIGHELGAALPEQGRVVALVLQLAAIPAAGWIWVALLGRLIDLLPKRTKKAALAPPGWEPVSDGDGSLVEFRAIPLRMRSLTATIVITVLVAGAATTALLIAFDDLVMRVGARVAIVAVGVLIALPVYAGLLAVLRRRTRDYILAFGDDGLRIRDGSRLHVIRYSALQSLVWRARSDYARVEARGGGVDLSLLVGLARPAAGRTSELPPLPRRVLRRLDLAGLTADRARRRETVRFRRAR